MTNQSDLTIPEAQTILRGFISADSEPIAFTLDKAPVQQALLLLAGLADYHMLGVCAETASEGYTALETYLTALGYSEPVERSTLDGPVYLKFNSRTGSCYLDSYSGKYRGVLVSCQSSQSEGINETFGHLPLDLFT